MESFRRLMLLALMSVLLASCFLNHKVSMSHSQNGYNYENKRQVEKYCDFPLKTEWLNDYDKLRPSIILLKFSIPAVPFALFLVQCFHLNSSLTLLHVFLIFPLFNLLLPPLFLIFLPPLSQSLSFS